MSFICETTHSSVNRPLCFKTSVRHIQPREQNPVHQQEMLLSVCDSTTELYTVNTLQMKKWKRTRLNLYATSCICMGKHTGYNQQIMWKQGIIFTDSVIFISFPNFILTKLELLKVCMIHFIFHCHSVISTCDVYLMCGPVAEWFR